MSAEFDNSSEYDQPELSELSTATLYAMAMDDINLSLLDKILQIATETYITDNTDNDAADLMQYIVQKKHDLGRHFIGEISEEELKDIEDIARETRRNVLALRAVEQSFFDSADLDTESQVKHLIQIVYKDTL